MVWSLGMVLCWARTWTKWSLRVPSNSAYYIILWRYLTKCYRTLQEKFGIWQIPPSTVYRSAEAYYWHTYMRWLLSRVEILAIQTALAAYLTKLHLNETLVNFKNMSWRYSNSHIGWHFLLPICACFCSGWLKMINSNGWIVHTWEFSHKTTDHMNNCSSEQFRESQLIWRRRGKSQSRQFTLSFKGFSSTWDYVTLQKENKISF